MRDREIYLFFSLVLVSSILAQPDPPSGIVNPCPPCVDGSDPLTVLADDNLLFCNSIVSNAQSVSVDSSDCELIQLSAFQAGCCASFPTDRCTLCPNGLDDGVNYEKFVSIGNDRSSMIKATCQDLVSNEEIQLAFLKEYLDRPGVCNETLLRRSAGWCGCTGENVECYLCDNGGNVLFDQQHMLEGTTCTHIEYEVEILSSDKCQTKNSMFDYDPQALCCSNVSPPNMCQLCGENQILVADRQVTTEVLGEVVCGVVHDAAALIATNSDCQVFQNEYTSVCCDSVVTVENAECELRCPDGSEPPDLSRVDPVSGYSCEGLMAQFAGLNDDECQNTLAIFGFDAQSFCCPDLVNPPNECSLCSSNQELLFYPERVLFAYSEFTCEQVQESLKYSVGSRCQRILDESRAERNCQCRDEPPSKAATSAPSEGGDINEISCAQQLVSAPCVVLAMISALLIGSHL